MKKSLLYLWMLLLCSASLFTGCSDDDDDIKDDEEQTGPVDYVTNDLAGTYKGTVSAFLLSMGDLVLPEPQPVGESAQNISITKAGDNAINLSIKNFSFLNGTILIPEIAVTNSELVKNGEVYDFLGTTTINMDNETMQLTGTANISGTIGQGKVSIDIDVPDAVLTAGEGETAARTEQHVSVTYEGTRLNGSENSEALITAFTFDTSVEANQVVNIQPVINEETKVITFSVAAGTTDEQLKALVPTITTSAGATLTPAGGEATDFTKVQTYTVLSEDGTATSVYTVNMPSKGSLTLKYSFEEWETVGSGKAENDFLLPRNIWGSSASGGSMLSLYGLDANLQRKTEDKVEGTYAASLTTIDASSVANSLVPGITSGSLFIGVFKLNIMDRLSSTLFGLNRSEVGMVGKPKTFKGYYKYQAGEKYLDATDYQNIFEVDMEDECSITAVLYEAKDEEGNDVTLTGHDINTSDYRVAYVTITSGTTAQDSFTEFEEEFTYLKEYDPAKEYKFAIVCASSKDGDLFKGAGGSTLIVDEFEVICE